MMGRNSAGVFAFDFFGIRVINDSSKILLRNFFTSQYDIQYTAEYFYGHSFQQPCRKFIWSCRGCINRQCFPNFSWDNWSPEFF